MLSLLKIWTSLYHIENRQYKWSACITHPLQIKTLTNATFHEEFRKLVCTITMSNKDLMILGEFDFHFDNPQDRDSKLLIQLLKTLCQNVSQSTYRQGHILDWEISRSVHSNPIQSTIQTLFSLSLLKIYRYLTTFM